MPLLETKGAASAQGFGEFAKVGAANYIEDVFSTWLYAGNSSTQTITNGIDLSGKGGMVWMKDRTCTASGGFYDNVVQDTNRGGNKFLYTNSTGSEGTSQTLTFNNNGFSIDVGVSRWNQSPDNYVSWTFRKQPKFFDVVTYTGDGTTGQSISHNLGSVPGCIIVKRTSGVGDWFVWHRGLTSTSYGILLDTTDAQFTNAGFLTATPTSTAFSLKPPGFDSDGVNGSGSTYVAYLFAHNAGGFGLTGTDNVISCGSFTAGNEVNLGWEPQWLLVKQSNGTAPWELIDNMRGFFAAPSTVTKYLVANTSASEQPWGGEYYPTATGFKAGYASGTYIYIAIRRGPMKTPTTGTSVFSPNTASGTFAATITTNFPVDLTIGKQRTGGSNFTFDRLRGGTSNAYNYLETNSTAAETTGTGSGVGFDNNTGILANWSSASYVWWNMRRAPGFFDVVCYTGTGANTTQAHNLGVAPEMMIVKRRNDVENWYVYHSALGATKRLKLNLTDAEQTALFPWNNTAPTSTVFSLANSVTGNGAGDTYVWYGFATVAGVSKVGSYTGTGSTLQIDCGFTGGARFVLIKRTDSTGDWYCWDSSRGIVSGNDSYLVLNSTAAEVTNTDWVDTYSAGFELSNAAGNNVNINGASYIFLSVA